MSTHTVSGGYCLRISSWIMPRIIRIPSSRLLMTIQVGHGTADMLNGQQLLWPTWPEQNSVKWKDVAASVLIVP